MDEEDFKKYFKVKKTFRGVSKETGLNPSALEILSVIGEYGRSTIGEVAQRTDQNQSSVSKLISDALWGREKDLSKRLVEKEIGDNQRERYVFLTKRGKEMYKKILDYSD